MYTLETRSNGHGTVLLEPIATTPARKPGRARWLALGAFVIVAAVVAIVVSRVRSSASLEYVTTPVARQTLVQSVTATGTVNAQNTIAVGTQVSGTISEIDVDFNSRVHKGQTLAKLDPTTFQASVDQSRAQLAQAQEQADAAAASASSASAQIGTADASTQAAAAAADAALATARSSGAAVGAARSNVTKSQSALTLAQATVNRDEALLKQGYIAQSQADSDRSNLVAAQTALDSANASVVQAQQQATAGTASAAQSAAQQTAQGYSATSARDQAAGQAATAAANVAGVSGAKAQLAQAQFNLDRTVVTSPVDGTVVARSISVGQTVAASFQTPTLFTIAQDLNKMEVDLSVGESDIGNVKVGDSVAFSVLAYPSRTFNGIVSQVRINPTTTTNVVTYTTVVLVDNRDGALLPGMTANAQIHVARTDNAIVVPSSALSYRPPAGTLKRRGANGVSSANAKPASGSPWGTTITTQNAAPGAQARLFVQRDGHLVPVTVKVVLVSGTQAAVQPQAGAGLNAGDHVVTGDSRAATTGSGRSSGPMSSRMMLGGAR